MNKKYYIAVPLIVLAVIFLIISKKWTPGNETTIENQPQSQQKGEQPSSPEVRQDPVLIKSLLHGVRLEGGNTPDGFTTIADVIAEEGQRIAEVRFLKRDANGRLSPQYLEQVQIKGDLTGNFSIGNKVGGAQGIRLAISGKEPPGYLCLRLGGRYEIVGFRFPGESIVTHTSPLEPTFTIPKELPPNSVYKVELVVLDEQLNKQIAEKKEIGRKNYERRAREESITVKIPKPLEVEMSRAAVFYQVEAYKENPYRIGKEAVFDKDLMALVPGPNKLGGELFVGGLLMGPTGQPYLWSYAHIRNLQKRSVNIPEDADLIIKKVDMIPVTISLDTANLPADNRLQLLGFFEKEESKAFLLAAIFSPQTDRIKDNVYEFDISVAPGKYILKLNGHHATEPWLDYLYLGKIEIKPDQKRYEVKIPESTDWTKIIKPM